MQSIIMAGIKFTWFYNSIRIGLHEYNCPEHAFAQTGSYIHACYMPVTCMLFEPSNYMHV